MDSMCFGILVLRFYVLTKDWIDASVFVMQIIFLVYNF